MWIGEEDDEDDDPGQTHHPDYDLSEAAGYPLDEDPDGEWAEQDKPWFLRRWVHLIIAALVITSLFLPVVFRIA